MTYMRLAGEARADCDRCVTSGIRCVGEKRPVGRCVRRPCPTVDRKKDMSRNSAARYAKMTLGEASTSAASATTLAERPPKLVSFKPHCTIWGRLEADQPCLQSKRNVSSTYVHARARALSTLTTLDSTFSA